MPRDNILIRRRPVLTGTAATIAVGALTGSALAAPNIAKRRTIKIGLVAPLTGPLAISFRPNGPFIIKLMDRLLGGQISIHGTKHPYEILLRDSQSDPNRASELAQNLIFNEHVDIMTASSAPETVNAASDQCEANGMPCIATASPLEPFYFGRGAPKDGFKWTYDFFFSFHEDAMAQMAAWNHIPTNRVLGVLWPNNANGQTDERHLPPLFKKERYKLVNPGLLDLSTNFNFQIAAFKAAGVEVVNGVLPPPQFITFWNAAAQQNFQPKIVGVAESVAFFSEVAPLGPRAYNLMVEVTWSPAFPYKSPLTGLTSPELAHAYIKATRREWSMLLGYPYALLEVAFHALQTAQDLDKRSSIRDAIAQMKYESLVGPIDFRSGPFPNTSQTPLAIGQWRKGAEFPLVPVVVDNTYAPDIPIQAAPEPIRYT